MRDHRPTLTDELITGSKLGQIQQHAGEIIKINQALSQILPKGVVDHCRAANVRSNHLVIEVASAAIKMKLDYDRLNILNQLRNAGFARLMAVEIRINPGLYQRRPGEFTSDKPAKKRAPLSNNAASALLMIASGAPPKVKKRLEKLAQLARDE
ncbi:DUF721 domain-containing protein [Vibrio sp. SCSIO 43135]|uniref:DciA family protein n=1 Tax=Vibrio paucivorans TaxID=2829489 RepID=A0A9X3CBV1_9VIBR|nr:MULTISPECIES: DciA family protein [Vibrio]MCW8332720.1 DciA family protein [Vibrio paucivorans]USD41638.1 DUF721 domain-containing protein [Vibrio sp. SCSIO 43135]